MKRKTIGALLCGFFIVGQSFGQIQNFNLSDYKLPELKSQSLEFDIDFSAYNSYYKYADPLRFGYEDRTSSQYSGYYGLHYNSFLNNASTQKGINTGMFLSMYNSKRKEDKKLDYKNSNFQPVFYYNSYNRKYYKSNRFYETDIDLDYNFNRDYFFSISPNESEYTADTKTHNLIGFLPVKVGIGRIEPVQDARLAVYLLDELSKQNSITSEINKDEIIAFAKLISQLKNKRFFDSRLRRIYELEAIDAFLDSNNYMLNKNINYFTTLSDFWDYGNRPSRNSGTRLAAAFYPGYSFYNYRSTVDGNSNTRSEESISSLIINIGVEYKKEKPMNLYWQNSLNINGFFGLVEGKSKDKTNDVSNTIRLPNLHFEFSQKIGFYPNTRTDIEFSYAAQYVQLFDKADEQNEILGFEGKALRGSTNLSINYYISPKFRLNIYSSLYYIWQNSDNDISIDFENLTTTDYYVNQFASNSSNYFYIKNQLGNSLRIKLLYSIY